MKILLLDTIHPVFRELVEKKEHACEDGSKLPREEVLKRIKNYAGIVIRSRISIDKELIAAAPNLRFIARAGAGMENIDVEYAMKKGIHCLNAPEGNRNAVAEHSLGMLLCLLNRLHLADREVRQGIWKREENRGAELDGQTLGIIGFGNTGSAFSKKLAGFDVRILAYDKYITIDTGLYPLVRQVNMEELFGQATILSLHVPLTPETDNLVNNEYIGRFKKNILLINTSRGRVVSTRDLVAGLRSGKITGACLDVFDFEDASFENVLPLQSEDFRYLRQSGRVVLTPHIAGWTVESHEKISRVLAKKILALGFVK